MRQCGRHMAKWSEDANETNEHGREGRGKGGGDSNFQVCLQLHGLGKRPSCRATWIDSRVYADELSKVVLVRGTPKGWALGT